MPWHDVVAGQCISSLAEQYGFTPERLWNDQGNEPLRELRADPNILEPGDRVFIPDRGDKLVDCATDERHRFVRHGVPAKFTLRLVDDGQGHSDRPYVARVGGKVIEGKTDAEGRVELWIPPRATQLALTLGEGPSAQTLSIQLGGLDPVTTLRGVQARLDNLGFECEVTGVLDELTTEAIDDFQHYSGHAEPTGVLDDATRAALATLHDENGG